ncbi:ImmA/IrrE family metallo-endopeptidase [Neobacillus mesonae]|uniref:ImmA/IrrE family metallo-endopeptidase n=1 Tax=Neobacillus mesonae TaxID=1193713 RepID=UPI002E1C6354|nr:ImmA/IrrE family metallo-endopeptidase [Neobacillus mesonae]
MDAITSRVKSLINKFDTNCPFKLANALGIVILYEDLGKILGYYSSHFRIKIIHINQNVDEGQQTFTCAHELGHAIFHPAANTPFLKKHTLFSTDRIELEAHLFAMKLLFSNINDTVSFDEAVKNYRIPRQLLNNIGVKNF